MTKKTIAIVGAGPGLGLAIARTFGQHDFNVALVARNRDRISGLAKDLQAEGIDAEAFRADACDEDSLASAFSAITARFGAVDVLEFSPMSPPTTVEERTPEGATVKVTDDQLRLQVLGAVASVRQVLPSMLERGSGTILITTGLSASIPIPVITPISAAMAAARQYALCLNGGLAERGVFVANVSIGVFIGSGDPGSDPAEIAEHYWNLYEKRDNADLVIGAPMEAMEDRFESV